MSLNKTGVSLVVINYNGFKITKSLVDSLLAAEDKGLRVEIVVVDNASEDESGEKLRLEYEQVKKVKVVRKPKNNFLAEAFNFGFKQTKEKIVVFMCNDLVVDKAWLVELVKEFEKKENGIAGVSLFEFKDKSKVDCLGCQLDLFLYGKRLKVSKRVDFVSGSVIGIRRDLFIKAGEFDVQYGGNYEDVDLALRVRRMGYRVVVAKRAVVYHRGSWTVDRYVGKENSAYLCRRNRLATMIKNYSVAKLIWVIPLYLGLQVIVLIKELVFERKLKLALTGVRAVGWNWKHWSYLMAWRKRIFNKGLSFVKGVVESEVV